MSELAFALGYMHKTAFGLPDWNSLSPAERDAIIGALLGWGVGGTAGLLMGDKDNRVQKAAIYGLAGAGAGSAGMYVGGASGRGLQDFLMSKASSMIPEALQHLDKIPLEAQAIWGSMNEKQKAALIGGLLGGTAGVATGMSLPGTRQKKIKRSLLYGGSLGLAGAGAGYGLR